MTDQLDPYFIDFDDDQTQEDCDQPTQEDDGWAQLVEASAVVEL